MGDIGRSAEQVKDNTMHALDTTGLSDRVFDVCSDGQERISLPLQYENQCVTLVQTCYGGF